jgi:hypothetical protein
MTILEPLLGEKIPYSSFMSGVNVYCQSKRFKEGKTVIKENAQRFLDEAIRGKNKGGD